MGGEGNVVNIPCMPVVRRTVYSRVLTMPGRNTAGFRLLPGGYGVHQARGGRRKTILEGAGYEGGGGGCNPFSPSFFLLAMELLM